MTTVHRGISCIAYREDGRICGGFAPFIDHHRGGVVCAAHRARGGNHGPTCGDCGGQGRINLGGVAGTRSSYPADDPICDTCAGEGRLPLPEQTP